ncbi:hypothetical protein JVU11DRAFT_8924 [Chiua virens]|nr:hypothetical protein JVU11DRAFT_8924 [Chiua virens]
MFCHGFITMCYRQSQFQKMCNSLGHIPVQSPPTPPTLAWRLHLAWWTGGNGPESACDAQIGCGGVATRFANTHGIRKMEDRTLIYCRWQGCHKWIKRKNFVRHIRERHLKHTRSK